MTDFNSLYYLYEQQFNEIHCGKSFHEISGAEISEIIKYCFSKREKSSAYKNLSLDDSNIFSKSWHELSVYLLGKILFNTLNCFYNESSLWKIISNQYKDRVTDSSISHIEEYNFDYLWSMASLYHDVATDFENRYQVNENDILSKYNGLRNNEDFRTFLKDKFDIQHNLYCDGLVLQNHNSFVHVYDEALIRQYFKMRMVNAKDHKKYDHGILAGYILYDRLCKNYLVQYEQHQYLHEGIEDFSTCNNNGIFKWEKEQIWLYAYIADAIIAHNIWHISRGNENYKGYEQFGLYRLIENNIDNRIDINKFPLAFLLGVVDTIEPVKYFANEQIQPIDVLKKFHFEISNNKITISSALKLKDWPEKVQSISDWLKIVKPEYEQNSKTITISKMLNSQNIKN